jgi:hypothetical protein
MLPLFLLESFLHVDAQYLKNLKNPSFLARVVRFKLIMIQKEQVSFKRLLQLNLMPKLQM